jgi:hypothetical protein
MAYDTVIALRQTKCETLAPGTTFWSEPTTRIIDQGNYGGHGWQIPKWSLLHNSSQESNSGRLKKMMIIYGSLGSLLMSARMDDATMEGSAKV